MVYKLKYIFLIILLFNLNCLDWIAEGDGRMKIVNNSKDTVFFIWHKSDTIPVDWPDETHLILYFDKNDSNSYSLLDDPNRVKKEYNCANCIYPGDSSTAHQLGNWDATMSRDSCIWVMVFNIDSYRKFSWDTIKKYQIIDKKIKVCREDKIDNQWRVFISTLK